jgi:amino acid adenylation domain-containing protein
VDSCRTLPELLVRSARLRPGHTAVVEPGAGRISYQELDRLSDALRDDLLRVGVRRGDRVGFMIPKSIDAVATIFGALKAGAAYVPVDPGAPAWRCAYILNDCSVKVVVAERALAGPVREEMAKLGPVPPFLVLERVGAGDGLRRALEPVRSAGPAPRAAPAGPEDLAYILYTSGSTGKPKGVMLSHRNAMSFIDWCSEVFAPRDEDRFSSHAPFHFDLSILDIYVPLKHGATLVLVSAEAGKDPVGLADLIVEERLTVWYSAPSILSMLAVFGKLERYQFPDLRAVLFAGEVFPVKHLRNLKRLVPHPRYYNLYGPTETNVCNYYEIPSDIPDQRTQPYPIGAVCSHLRGIVVDENGREVPRGSEGELCIAGPSVLAGYWNLPDHTARAFLSGRDDGPWYRTGDIVVEPPDGQMIFVGRRDRMVKRRGYRIELAEIEAGLYRHPAIKEAAVVARKDDEGGVRLRAFLSFAEGRKLSIIELKRFCAEALPIYMVPDDFAFRDALPKTSTDKIDYQRLMQDA